MHPDDLIPKGSYGNTTLSDIWITISSEVTIVRTADAISIMNTQCIS